MIKHERSKVPGIVDFNFHIGCDAMGRRIAMSDFPVGGSFTKSYWVGWTDRSVLRLNNQQKIVQGFFNDPHWAELFLVDVAPSNGSPIAYWSFGTGGGTAVSWAEIGQGPTQVTHTKFDSYGNVVGTPMNNLDISQLPKV